MQQLNRYRRVHKGGLYENAHRIKPNSGYKQFAISLVMDEVKYRASHDSSYKSIS